MRVLLDECVPRGLRRELAGHAVRTVQEEGWAGLRDGELLDHAQRAGVEVFLTLDRGLIHQQQLSRRTLAVVVIRSKSNDIADLRPIIPAVIEAIDRVRPGGVAIVKR